ncbi:MAG: RICIN domain-containing protein [bacterium]
MKITSMSSSWLKTRMIAVILLIASIMTGRACAEDWGAYTLVPVSAQALVLEAVNSGTNEGTVVSINKPAGTANQKWIITSKSPRYYSIKPSYSSTLVLAASKGGTASGTPMVLENDQGQPWQEWEIKKNDNSTYSLFPKHAPDKGLDDLGGNQTPGAKQDLWTYHPSDPHLQWMIKPLAGSPVTNTDSQQNTYIPPAIKPEDVLQGVIKSCSFTNSMIFPGTHRTVTVFIPAQYNASTSACVYVKSDGYNSKEKELLETLIATHEMPVTIGVFVTPGMLQAPVKNTLGRRNRCFEYDGVGDNNVRFLTDELLPFIAKEFNLNLSTNGNDRCIAGGSSGGISAFNTAWERPEAFSRVYANSGSFVAFRGGHEFPTLVRKFEPKPIRAFLTTGMRDMENCAGDWFLLDQEMDKALKFSGYDYVFRVFNGGHVAGYYDCFREAMSYLWKEWPLPVKAGDGAPRVRDILLPGEGWQRVTHDSLDARGAACNATGEVFFVDSRRNTIRRMDLDGNVTVFAGDAGQANALTFGVDGRLYAVSSQTGNIMSYDPSGKGKLEASGIFGNAILAMPAGGLYVSGTDGTQKNSGAVWHVKEGKVTLVDSGLKRATGLAYRPDQWLLSVADGNSKWVYSYQINTDQTLTHKERFFWLHVPDWEDDAGTESLCYAKEGQMFAATRWGIQVCADDGPTQVILPLPDHSRVMGVCLGGRDMDTLFAFCGNAIWKRKVKVHAMGAFTPWTAVKNTKL